MPADTPMEDATLPKVYARGLEAIDEGIQSNLSTEDLKRTYQSWNYCIIIKLMNKCILHHYLKKKIQEIWRPTENFILADLGADYFIVKFNKEENMIKSLHNGPWFINGFFLSVQKWNHNSGKARLNNSFQMYGYAYHNSQLSSMIVLSFKKLETK